MYTGQSRSDENLLTHAVGFPGLQMGVSRFRQENFPNMFVLIFPRVLSQAGSGEGQVGLFELHWSLNAQFSPVGFVGFDDAQRFRGSGGKDSCPSAEKTGQRASFLLLTCSQGVSGTLVCNFKHVR